MKSKIYQDAFDLLGLVPRFDINLKELEKNYETMQIRYNPELFLSQTSGHHSARKQILEINRAYVQMVCPISRLVLLLHRMNVNISAKITSSFLDAACAFGENWEKSIAMGQVVKVQHDLIQELSKSYLLAVKGWELSSGNQMVCAYQEMNIWINMAQNLNINWQEKQLQEVCLFQNNDPLSFSSHYSTESKFMAAA